MIWGWNGDIARVKTKAPDAAAQTRIKPTAFSPCEKRKMIKVLIMCMPDIYQTWNPTHVLAPWLGGASIAGNCRGHEVNVGDLVLKRDNLKVGIDEAIRITKPQVIGLSAMTFQYPTACRIASYIKVNYPEIPIVLGGYHATALREEIASSEEGNYFDYIFAGEAEHTFKQFLDGENEANISGFSYKKNGKWIHNPRHKAISMSEGINTIALPKRDSRIWSGYHFYVRAFDTAEFSRGCDYACKFCSMRSMMPNAKFVAFDLERVINDLKITKSRGVKSVFFTDDNPAMNPGLFKVFLNRIISEGLNDIFYSGMVSTERMADRQLTKLMRSAGWDFVFLGVENIYDTNLKGMRKHSSEDLAKKAIESLHDAGIITLAGTISGNPDDNEETIRGNIRWYKDYPVDEVMPQFITPYPGTVSRNELLKEGLVINEGGMNNKYGGWSTYNGEFAHCKTKSGLMPEDIERIVYEEMQAFNSVAMIKNLISGNLNFPKRNPKHFLVWVMKESIPSALTAIKEIGKSSATKATLERERKIAMNKFNI